ncbi:AAA ATPase-like protein [Streptomyces sp. 2132.2]|uniref:AAA family ATPase n=1 Tax=Streptomyces sp. 2132.2 TaxID=2485161 RepID=UPI000F46E49A|nr:AAA family ATPase [Streptomyces sp. 2132.2]ROQ99718.1 AAA ATPase-like protein [Streptomyces sp. 2132.2]
MHVDRVEQLAHAARVIGDGASHRALFFEGDEGIGKTALLIEVHRRHGDSTVCYVDLATTWAAFDVLNHIYRQASGQGIRMDSFRALKQRYGEVPTVNFQGMSMNRSYLDLALSVNADRETQNSAMSDELVARLAESASAPGPGPIVVLDGFDRCEPPLQSWISTSFLPDLLATRRITVFLAGRSVPSLSHPYAGAVRNLILPPFDAATVQEWIDLAGIDELKGSAEELCGKLDGLPSAISEFLSHFTREG